MENMPVQIMKPPKTNSRNPTIPLFSILPAPLFAAVVDALAAADVVEDEGTTEVVKRGAAVEEVAVVAAEVAEVTAAEVDPEMMETTVPEGTATVVEFAARMATISVYPTAVGSVSELTTTVSKTMQIYQHTVSIQRERNRMRTRSGDPDIQFVLISHPPGTSKLTSPHVVPATGFPAPAPASHVVVTPGVEAMTE